MTTNNTKDVQTVSLESSDSKIFKVIYPVAMMSVTIKNLMGDLETTDETMSDTPVPLPNVNGYILEKVIEFLEYHHEHPSPIIEEKDAKKSDNICAWDKAFCNVDQPTLFELILAANYLDIKILLDAACKTVANMIKGKTPEEIRKTFNIKNDFTPEEEEAIRKENEWCEEK